MKKTLVVDTSVLVFDPKCLESKQFENANIILPIQVLEELDKLKKFPGEAGKNARHAIRYIDEISSGGEIHNKIDLPNGSTIKADCNIYELIGEDSSYNDNKILGCALGCVKNKKAILVSRDINLRIRARAAGLIATDYSKEKNGDLDDYYSGVAIINDDQIIQDFMEKKAIDGSQLDLFPHQNVIFKDDANNEVAFGRYSGKTIKPVRKTEVWGQVPKNTEQMFALNMIMDPNLPLVTISGSAGSGKSFISLAAALELVLEQNKYEKLIIMRPIETVGDGIGYLPGDMSEKLDPYFAAIMDNFEVLFSSSSDNQNKKGKRSREWRRDLEMFISNGKISLEPITFMRGRSIANALIIVDEAQNLKPEDAKTMLSRISNSSKIIIEGDFSQIDAKNLDESQNCLTTVIEAFKESKLAGHITFKETHRSDLAAEAIERL